MKPRFSRRIIAFTLVELLVTIAIIGLLGSLTVPAINSAIQSAKSATCAGNLRQIGIAVSTAATDNNNTYPEIDQAAEPVYPPGSGAQGLVMTLASYGITTNSVKCPVDISMGKNSSFTKYGSSYEWNPTFDNEVTTSPIIYVNSTFKIPLNSGRVRLCTDFQPIHHGRMNALYGDGHVKAR
jgi:general secretion pathway protein G